MEEPPHDPIHDRTRERYAGRCGYCGVHEDDAGASLTVDHYRPRRHAGSDGEANLVYCCPKCNQYKGAYWHETDVPHIRLLHPLRDALKVHLQEEAGGVLKGLSPEGVFFIQRLRLNRPQLVAYRQSRRAERMLEDEVLALHRRVETLQQRIAELNSRLEETSNQIERESRT